MTPHDCPTCGADALVCETTGEARRGGGYHRRCPLGHEWDDPAWSYIRADAIAARRAREAELAAWEQEEADELADVERRATAADGLLERLSRALHVGRRGNPTP